jgi:hypothetical protein
MDTKPSQITPEQMESVIGGSESGRTIGAVYGGAVGAAKYLTNGPIANGAIAARGVARVYEAQGTGAAVAAAFLAPTLVAAGSIEDYAEIGANVGDRLTGRSPR